MRRAFLMVSICWLKHILVEVLVMDLSVDDNFVVFSMLFGSTVYNLKT